MKFARTLSVLTVLLALGGSSARADEKPEPVKVKMVKPMEVDASLAAALEANERKVNEAWKNKDVATFNSMVDPNGWSADPTGFSPVSTAAAMMNDYTVGNYTIAVNKIVPIDKDAYIVLSTWKGEASYKGQAMPPVPSYTATVWAKRGKDWKAVYHQETMAPPPAPAAETH